MRKAFKIILICVVAAIGIFCGFAILYDILLYFRIIIPGYYIFAELLPIPIFLFLMAIPSFIFNIKTLKPNFNDYINDKELIDNYVLNEIGSNKNSFNISRFLWISNCIFGIILITFSTIIFIIIIKTLPISDLPTGFGAYLLSLGIWLLGVSIIIDEIYLLILKKKQKTKLKELN